MAGGNRSSLEEAAEAQGIAENEERNAMQAVQANNKVAAETALAAMKAAEQRADTVKRTMRDLKLKMLRENNYCMNALEREIYADGEILATRLHTFSAMGRAQGAMR
jgi:hypothetical protein